MAANAPSTLSYAALSERIPPSNQPGAFPVALVMPGESILFETRPVLWRLYPGRFIVLGLFGLILAAPVETPGYVEDPFFGIFEGIIVLLFVYWVIGGRRSAYALTDRRVLSVRGFSRGELNSLAIEEVTHITLDDPNIRFEVGKPKAWAPGAAAGIEVARKLVWTAAPRPLETYTFAQYALNVHAAQAKILASRTQLEASLVTCAFCGGQVDLRLATGPSPQCPFCGAPLLPPAPT